jgi:hypothetical protein
MEPSFFAIPVLAAGLLTSSIDKIILIFLICFVFGGTATISLTALGGAPILPAVLFMPFVFWKALNEKTTRGGTNQLAYPNPGFWLVLLVLYELLTAYIFPRIFQGEIQVYVVDRGAFSGVALQPLKPVSTNLTQSLYSILGILAFYATSRLNHSTERLINFRNSVLVISCLDILAVFIQLGESYLGLPPILSAVRNADYAMFSNYEMGGLIRLQGTFPEASAFSSFTLPLFAFAFTLYRHKAIPLYSGTLAIFIFCLLLLSTSTTTYFSLGLYLITIFFSFIGQAFSKGSQVKIGKVGGIVWLFLVLICLSFLINPDLITRIFDFFDLTLFNKLESSSGKERSAWNWQGVSNFIETYGIGVGFASNRSSNFFVALISNVGILGTSLFVAFIWKTSLSPTGAPCSPESQIIIAAKNALLISSFSLFASSSFADPGMFFYVFAAVATAGSNLNSNLNLKKKSEPGLASFELINPELKSL